jgi:hypothetical protein
MKHDPSNSKNLRSARNLETKIGNLAHQLLSTGDYERSVEIATDLISAIRDLIDERRRSN